MKTVFSYILYGLIWLVGLLPFRLLYLISDVNYFIFYYIVRYRRKIVRINLKNSFPDKSEKEIIYIEKKFYKHLSDTFMEFYKLWHMSEKSMMKRCSFENTELPERYFKEGRSVIGVLGHYGNWEWMSSYSLWTNRADFLVLYKPLRNKVINNMTKRIRSKFGAIPVDKDDILRTIAGYRNEKKTFLAGFIGDQTPNKYNLNFWTSFLNQDTPVLVGTEKIAKKYNFPVVSVKASKVKRGYYKVEFIDVCSEPATLAAGELTEIHTKLLESYIMEEPWLWLWSHKRWKHKKPNGDE